MANSKDTLFKSQVNNYIGEKLSQGTTPPAFSVTNDGSGNYTISKFNGDVTLTLVDGNYVFTPTRGSAVTVAASSVSGIVVDFITLNADASIIDGKAITGSGIVELNPSNGLPQADLTHVQSAVLSATIIGDAQTPTLLEGLSIGSPTVGRIIKISQGEVELNETLQMPADTSLVVEAGATLTLSQTQADDSASVSGQGTIHIPTQAPTSATAFTFTDTGISTTDGITSNGAITLALATDTASWQYSTNGGTTWTNGSGSSFTLPDGTYDIQNIQIKQFNATGSSSISSLGTSTSGMVQLEALNVTGSSDYRPQITALQNGEFAVTFEGYDSNGDVSIFVQKFNADGTTTNNTMVQLERLDVTDGDDFQPQITALADGTFVVTFHGYTGSNSSVFVQKFNADGTTTNNTMVQLEALGVTNGFDYDPQITALADGAFAVTFQGYDSNGDVSIFVQKFNADGTTTNNATVQLEALGVTYSTEYYSKITALADGAFAVSFTGVDSNGNYSIFVQKFNADGTTTNNAMVQLERFGITNGYEYPSQVTGLADGAFAVTFYGYDSNGNSSIFVQKFNADGTTTNNAMVQLEALSVTYDSAWSPQITALTDGAFAVTFYGDDSNGFSSIFVQKFNADGTTTNNAMVQLEALGVTNGNDYDPQITALADGAFAVTFQGYDSDGDSSIFVQKFNADGTLAGDTVVSDATTLVIDTTTPTTAVTNSITNTDTNSDSTGVYAAGDKITFAFSEPIDATTLTLGDISLNNSHSFGTGATLTALNSVDGFASTFEITLGTTPTVAANDTLTIASSKAVDVAGNANSSGIAYTVPLIADVVTPTFTATLTDGTLTFGGTATGDITMSTDNDGIATFVRGGITATTTPNWDSVTKVIVDSGQTLKATAEILTDLIIEGAGNVVVTGTAGEDYLYIYTSGTNSITGGAGSEMIWLGNAAANGGVDTMIIANGDSSVGTPDQIVYFELDKDKLDLPSTTIATSSVLTDLSDITIISTTIGQTTITNGIATFQAADNSMSVEITTADALSAALDYLAGAIVDTQTVAFTYDLGSGNSGTYIFQGGASGDIVVDLVGVSVTGGDLPQIII